MPQLCFIIYGYNYNAYSGGIIALHYLAKHLYELGEQVYIYCDYTDPVSKVPLWSKGDLPANHVVIYPEVVEGNPLKAHNIVRWALNTPGKIKKDTQKTWNESDIVYTFLDYFKVDSKFQVKGNLRAFNFREDFFQDFKRKRIENIYTSRKSFGKPLTYHSSNFLCIDDQINANNFDRLVNIFNESNIFLSYDTCSYYSLIACLCGATSIVVPDKGITKEQWHNLAPTMKYGVAYGFEDIQWALDTKDKVRPYLIELYEESLNLIKQFILDCKIMFNGAGSL